MRRAPLATLACLLVLVKAIQYAIDSTAIFYFDSGAFILNALGALFHPTRSYFWGYLMRAVALPFHSLRAIVATQVAMGAVTAWLLGFMLLRFLRVRPTVAVLAALVFSIDPLQVVHERLVMAECAALFVMALFLIAAADYLEAPRWWKPGILALLGVVLVGMRIVYLPLVVLAAVLLPVAAYVWSPGLNNVRSLVATLAISCAATAALQLGYTHLTGWLAGREAAYNYEAGFFQLSGVAPIVDASDSDDPRVTRAIEEQNRTAFPLANARLRPRQLWDAQGIRLRLTAAFNGDERAANEAAQKLARTAIRRHPLRYARLGAHTYLEFWRYYRGLRHSALYEVGMAGNEIVKPWEVRAIQAGFGVDVSHQDRLRTPSRRYFLATLPWYLFLLVSPFVLGLVLCVLPRSAKFLLVPALLFLWSWMLIAATCLGAVEVVYRFLHPLSFTGIAGAAMLVETALSRTGRTPR